MEWIGVALVTRGLETHTRAHTDTQTSDPESQGSDAQVTAIIWNLDLLKLSKLLVLESKGHILPPSLLCGGQSKPAYLFDLLQGLSGFSSQTRQFGQDRHTLPMGAEKRLPWEPGFCGYGASSCLLSAHGVEAKNSGSCFPPSWGHMMLLGHDSPFIDPQISWQWLSSWRPSAVLSCPVHDIWPAGSGSSNLAGFGAQKAAGWRV